jgi:hypothetical protein
MWKNVLIQVWTQVKMAIRGIDLVYFFNFEMVDLLYFKII